MSDWPQPWRCPSVLDGDRCQKLRLPHPWHSHKEGLGERSWGRHADKRATYETTAPWVTWLWLSTDRETRITGRTRMQLTCAVCGATEVIRGCIPRFGAVPEPPNGVHPARLEAIERHAHPDRGHPMSWAKPLLNPITHDGELDLAMLAMRLEADLADGDGERDV